MLVLLMALEVKNLKLTWREAHAFSMTENRLCLETQLTAAYEYSICNTAYQGQGL